MVSTSYPMQTPKKRKRDAVEVAYPRITYDAPSKTFDRLFKEDSLESMKDVVRRKLCVATSVPIYLSQERDGQSVALEDDEDFDAFHAYALASHAFQIKVVVGSEPSDAPSTRSLPNGDLKKKTKKKSNKTEPSAMVDSSPPQKKRRVSFVERPGDQAEQNMSVVVATPGKKKRNSDIDPSPPSELGNQPPSDLGVSMTNEATEKKKKREKKETGKQEKKKNAPAIVNEELVHTDKSATIPETTPKKRRTKEDTRVDTSEILEPQVDEEDDTQPAKRLKKNREKAVDESIITKNLGLKPVPPSVDNWLHHAVPDVEQGGLVTSKKTQRKERVTSELPSVPLPGSSETVAHEEASHERKNAKKSKVTVDEASFVDPSTSSGVTATKVKKKKDKQAQQKEMPPSDLTTPDPSTKRKNKPVGSSQASVSKLSAGNRKESEESSSPPETEAPRKRGKSQASEINPLKSKTVHETSRDPDNSQEVIKEGVEAAIQAVLARKNPTTSAPQVQAGVQPPTFPSPLVAASSAQEDETEEHLPACPLCDESPTHDRSLCPVIKGGVRTMRKRLAQLEQETPGDEAQQEERQRVITELQAIIQKRSRKPKVLNATDGSAGVKKAAVVKKGVSTTPAPIVEAKKTAKQVDVVSPPARVVDVEPAASSQSVKSAPSIAKSLKPTQHPSNQQKPIVKTAQDKSTTEILKTNLPLVSDPSMISLADIQLSKYTKNDLQSIIHGPKMSITDMTSSDEDEEDQEEPVLDEDEDEAPESTYRRLSRATRLEYPSSSDAENSSAEESVTKARAPSISTDGEGEADDREVSEEPLAFGEGDSSFRDVDTRGSSREIDTAGDDAVEAALAGDLATLNAVLPINGKLKTTEADSDTAVGSQGGDPVDLRASEEKERTLPVTTVDPIEPPHEPSDEQPDLIVSEDDHPPFQSTLKVESIIRTRSQRKKDEHEEDSVVHAPKTKKTKKITEMPVPSLPSARLTQSSSTPIINARTTKTAGQQDQEVKDSDGAGDIDDRTPKPSTKGKVASKALAKNMKRSNTKAKVEASESSKSKAMSRITASTTVISKPKFLHETEPIALAEAINKASDKNNDNNLGSQWAVLAEGNASLLTETPGQVDELISNFSPPASASREPLFKSSETPQSFPYSQYSLLSSQRRDKTPDPSHESEDEEEVLASVVKVTKPRTYRGLSQIASSQTFMAPNFQPADFGRAKEPASLYGKGRDMVSDTESSSESELEPPISSHIPLSRRAGFSNK